MTQFVEKLNQEREKLGLSWSAFARYLEVPQKTLEDWRYRDRLPKEKYQKVINDKFPGFFQDELFMQKTHEETIIPIPLPPKSVRARVDINETDFRVKIELVKERVLELSRLLWWFLYEANAEERNKLRTEMDTDWEWFINLTRAMMGESAFTAIENEGSLNPERRPRL